VPRHPPCALSSLSCYKDARVHCVVLKLRAVPPAGLRLPAVDESVLCREFAGAMARREVDDSIPQDPTVCLACLVAPARGSTPCPSEDGCGCTDERLRGDRPNNRRSTSELVCRRTFAFATDGLDSTVETGCQMLLRKEVIQPHLPVRLPCYDFVPIASPTFDGSLHKGWATGFGCCRLS
jgi:hypothetical protein